MHTNVLMLANCTKSNVIFFNYKGETGEDELHDILFFWLILSFVFNNSYYLYVKFFNILNYPFRYKCNNNKMR